MDNSRTRVTSGSPFEKSIGFSRAIRAGSHVFVSGTAPVGPNDAPSPDVAAQTRRCYEIALDALAELGGKPEHVVRTRNYLVNAGDVEEVSGVHGELFGDIRPAATMLVVAALLDPRWKIEIEIDAIIPE